MIKAVWFGLLLNALICGSLAAQDPVLSPLISPKNVDLGGQGFADSATSQAPGKRWMLICCGLPGDDAHREKFTTAAARLVSATEPVFEVAPERLRVLVGDEEMADALKDSITKPETCTSEEIAASLQEFGKQIEANDSLWVIFLGHAQLYSGRSSFNVKGTDFDAKDLAKWLAPVQCRERVLMLTMPVSGFWIKPLRGPRTVVISATDADFEFTGTEMPYALANVVSGNSEQALDDIDQDGSISLLDLYLATNLEIHATFKSLQRLQTEHAQIDDNGDGVGRELQQPYIPVEAVEGEVPSKPVAIKRVATTNSDGDFARTLKLVKPAPVAREVIAE